MNEPDNSIFFEDRICNPVDSSFEQLKFAAANVQIDKRGNIDPVTTAGLLLKSRSVRLEQFRNDQTDIDDISWHILLDLMVSMNREEPVTVHDLAVTHDLAMNTMSRYVDYLSGIGLVDKNFDAEAEDQVSLRLTAAGEALASTVLEKIGHELVNF